jgi:hypothetical protein
MNNINAIITHPGQSHRDEFLLISLVMAVVGRIIPVFRRNPTEAELADPSTLVVDVGEQYDPAMGNFDHHQKDEEVANDCALSLWLRAMQLEPIFEIQDWYQTSITLDIRGPFALAKELGLPSFPFALMSPVEKSLLGMFSKCEEVPESLLQIMKAVGDETYSTCGEAYDFLLKMERETEVQKIGGVEALVQDFVTPGHLSYLSQMFHDRNHPEAGILVARDNRGDGWTLYRFNDHPQVDFSHLGEYDNVVFAHPGGFIAKTKEMSLGDAKLLAWECVSA